MMTSETRCRSIVDSMKFVLFCICLAAFAWSQATTPSSPASAPAETPNSQTPSTADPGAVKARQLIAQMIQALGGDAFMHITDLEQDGRTNSFYHGQPSGGTAPFWRFYKFPDKERVELTKQRDWIIIHNGGRGTETTFHGTRPEDDDAHREYLLRDQYSMENVLRNWLNAPGTVFFYEGTGFTDNHQVEKATIANAQDQQVTFSVDEFNHLPVRKSFTVRDPKYKDKDTYAEIYSEYRPVQGIQTPFVITREKNGEMISQRFLSKVTYNQGLQDGFFEAPTSFAKKK
jgi:hypothetical protein